MKFLLMKVSLENTESPRSREVRIQIREGRIDTVVCLDPDRLSGNYKSVSLRKSLTVMA